MTYRNHSTGIGSYIFCHPIIELGYFIFIIGYIGTHIPFKVFDAEYICADINFYTTIPHGSHIIPTGPKTGRCIRNRNRHQHIGRFLIIKLHIQIDTINKT